MRVGVISDVHANLTALQAVREDWGAVDDVWCLGDVVGYGPRPNECVAILRDIVTVWLPGNHDWAAIGKLSVAEFNPAARLAAEWTGRELDTTTRELLEALPERVESPPFTTVHGSPRDPIMEYVLDVDVARACFDAFTTPYCLLGHSHVPLMFIEDDDQRVRGWQLLPSPPFALDAVRRIINPGSVGQPRDGDPRASYGILDIDGAGEVSFALHRVGYDIAETQAQMRQVRLPDSLVRRLEVGR